jgi:ribosomal protein S18 acetylase RimI-like enzyme
LLDFAANGRINGPMGTGGDFSGEGAGGRAPARVAVERKEPRRDLAPGELEAWQNAAGPLYRLPCGETLTAAGAVIYAARDRGEDARVDGGREIGYLRLAVPPRRNFCEIRGLWVDLNRRREGIGRRLVDEAIAVELDDRRPHMLAFVPRRNDAARKFFFDVGFRGDTTGERLARYVYSLPHRAES